MGKSCIRFKKLDDLALDVIGEAIRRLPARKFIVHYESSVKDSRHKPAAKSARAKKKSASR